MSSSNESGGGGVEFPFAPVFSNVKYQLVKVSRGGSSLLWKCLQTPPGKQLDTSKEAAADMCPECLKGSPQTCLKHKGEGAKVVGHTGKRVQKGKMVGGCKGKEHKGKMLGGCKGKEHKGKMLAGCKGKRP